MKKCDPRAKAKCPYKNPCCGDKDDYFLEGSYCDEFNQEVTAPPPTNAETIRAMSDEELAVDRVERSYQPHAVGEMSGMYFCSDGNATDDANDAVERELDWISWSAEEVE